LRQGTPIGVFALTRDKVNPFTDKQIELVTTFADQAVIAIENTRLFDAEQQRTRELSESMQEQTATSQVLQVISSSPGDLEPVLGRLSWRPLRHHRSDQSCLREVEARAYAFAEYVRSATIAGTTSPAGFASALSYLLAGSRKGPPAAAVGAARAC
jgi:hypothetical protein